MIDHPSNRCDGGHVPTEGRPELWAKAAPRFWEKVNLLGDCWLWESYVVDGWGRFWFDGESTQAHRWAYEYLVGPIPLERELDHLCHTFDLQCLGGLTCPHRRCVRPEHLEPVTRRENSLRIHGGTDIHCPQGHLWNEENTFIRSGGKHGAGKRVCRACNRDRARANPPAKVPCQRCEYVGTPGNVKRHADRKHV